MKLGTLAVTAIVVGTLCPFACVVEAAPRKAPSGRQIVRLRIEGMSCANCSMGLAAKVLKLKGVRSADFLAAKKLGVVEIDPKTVRPEAVVAAIKAAGYGVRRIR